MSLQGLAETFIDAALSDLRRAEEMLVSHPQFAEAGLYAALVLGDAEHVEQELRKDPGFVRAKGGPREWEPLLYVCFSRFATGGSRRAGGLVTTARALLRARANPNASYIHEAWPNSPLSCLYGATGLNNNRLLDSYCLRLARTLTMASHFTTPPSMRIWPV